MAEEDLAHMSCKAVLTKYPDLPQRLQWVTELVQDLILTGDLKPEFEDDKSVNTKYLPLKGCPALCGGCRIRRSMR